jgi:gamma-glutamylcyclotransferase (GGCT)/AIG2-like uncharacterized protein YtfP
VTRVFVYGTLKRGGSNHRLLSGQRFVGVARTRPEFRLYELDGYPGMVRGPGPGRSIEGELWEVDPPCLERLDDLEGLGTGLYAREPILLLPPHDGTPVQTYVYLRAVDGRTDLGEGYPVQPPR